MGQAGTAADRLFCGERFRVSFKHPLKGSRGELSCSSSLVLQPKTSPVSGGEKKASDLLQIKALTNKYLSVLRAQLRGLGSNGSCPDSLSQLGTRRYEVPSCNHTSSNEHASSNGIAGDEKWLNL